MASAPPTAASFTPMRGRAGQGFAGPAGTVTGRDCLRESCTQDDASQVLGFVRIIDRDFIKKAAARDPRTRRLKRGSASLVASAT